MFILEWWFVVVKTVGGINVAAFFTCLQTALTTLHDAHKMKKCQTQL